MLSGMSKKVCGARWRSADVAKPLALKFIPRRQRILTGRRPVKMDISRVDRAVKNTRRRTLKTGAERSVCIVAPGRETRIIAADQKFAVDNLIDDDLPVKES